MFLSSDPVSPLPWEARRIHCHVFYCFQGHKITKFTTVVSLFWSNPKEESCLSLWSTGPVDSHPSSSYEVPQSGLFDFSFLLVLTPGGREVRTFCHGFKYLERTAKRKEYRKRKLKYESWGHRKQKSLGVQREKCSPYHKLEISTWGKEITLKVR